MRASLLFALVAGTAAASPWPEVATALFAQDVKCDVCVEVMTLAMQAAQNQTTLEAITRFLDAECVNITKGKSNETLAACELIAKGLVDLLPFIDKQLSTLAWDIPLGFCSVFVPVCKQPCCASHYAPEQLHLSFASNDLTTLRAAWVTLNETATSTVQWGPAVNGSAPVLPQSAAGSNRTYTVGGWLGVIHEAVMTGLAPGTQYWYRVGDASAAGGWSDVYNFTTLPAAVGTPARPLRLIQIADMGYGNASNATVAAITTEVDAGSVDAVIHPGDVSYADGFMNHWDVFFRKIQPFAARVPYMTGAGNHELWYNFTAYKARNFNPGPAAGEVRAESMFYSLDLGPLHLVMTNTETAIDTADIDAAQAAWIKADLAAVNANRTAHPWIVAAGHRPMYCTDGNPKKDKDCVDFAAILRSQVEDAYIAAKVDLVVAGHMHGYERFWPTAHSNATQHDYNSPAAPVYVVNGAAGNREGNDNPRGDLPFSVPGAHTAIVGYGRLSVAGGALSYAFVDSANGTVLDSFVVTKAL